MIPAHDSPVAAMAFNSAGTKLSTASEKARLIYCILLQAKEHFARTCFTDIEGNYKKLLIIAFLVMHVSQSMSRNK